MSVIRGQKEVPISVLSVLWTLSLVNRCKEHRFLLLAFMCTIQFNPYCKYSTKGMCTFEGVQYSFNAGGPSRTWIPKSLWLLPLSSCVNYRIVPVLDLEGLVAHVWPGVRTTQLAWRALTPHWETSIALTTHVVTATHTCASSLILSHVDKHTHTCT